MLADPGESSGSWTLDAERGSQERARRARPQGAHCLCKGFTAKPTLHFSPFSVNSKIFFEFLSVRETGTNVGLL